MAKPSGPLCNGMKGAELGASLENEPVAQAIMAVEAAAASPGPTGQRLYIVVQRNGIG